MNSAARARSAPGDTARCPRTVAARCFNPGSPPVRAGSVARQVMGTTVIGGMLAASFMGVFLIPVLYYVVEKLTGGKAQAKKAAEPAASATQSAVITGH